MKGDKLCFSLAVDELLEGNGINILFTTASKASGR